ncbi:pentapeptide repeat-containing protein [Bacillus paranthracis]|uniref:pentapeptide repeat-containing protein n=1 Tax=Bacillus paranthracis TaxID=2026186 RepID=UPI001879E647|nr:pentapeptide repeat-containing protein [Bacillus paranthracis]MBE7141793.1 AAA family ATPase [Bacillus paranthracis]
MGNSVEGLKVKKTIASWNKPLKVDFKDLFKSLAKIGVHATTGAWDKAAVSAIDAGAALGFGTDKGQVAWLLIYRSLSNAVYDLVIENNVLLDHVDDVCNQIDFSLEDEELLITEDFFLNPKSLSIVEVIQHPFYQWLTANGLNSSQANAIVHRLPSYFVFALHEEWARKPDEYKVLQDSLKTPFSEASKREKGWELYSSHLNKVVNEPMLSETFSVEQIYVPLRGYIECTVDEDEEVSELNDETNEVIKTVIDIETDLMRWIDNPNKKDALRIISGGPGSGKSTFAKIFAAKLAVEKHIPTLFIPLHQLMIQRDLEDAIQGYIKATGMLHHNPLDLDLGNSRLVIVFDGLDELSKQGASSAEVASRFIEEIEIKLRLLNMHSARLQIIITGRELSVQENKHRFRKENQIIHVLPYFVSNMEVENYDDPHGILAEDQRELWWKLYGNVTGATYEGLPEELKMKKLDELTAQPLLNYLIALSYNREEVDFSITSNLNEIYKDLLKAVYERGWSDNQHPSVIGITEKYFIRILEAIAVSVWHNTGRTTKIADVEKYCVENGLKSLLDKFQEGASLGLTRLLTAFYFRQSRGLAGLEKTFEFTHKSFVEYLVARRIISVLCTIQKRMEEREEDPDEGMDERDALVRWIELCGKTEFDQYLYDFVLNELKMHDVKKLTQLQNTLTRLFNYILKHGSPIDRIVPRMDFRDELKQVCHAEKALLIILNMCAQLTQTVVSIQTPVENAFGTWLLKVREQRMGRKNDIIMNCLSHLNLENNYFEMQDMYRAKMSYAILDNASLIGTMLATANLRHAKLNRATLNGAILTGANLTHAEMKGASLKNVRAKNAVLVRGDLESANLERARFENTRLNKANLSNTNLRRATFQGAKLLEANLAGANLTETNLSGTNLRKAILERACLRRARLCEADLTGADLTGADLTGADLTGADLAGADLTGADLTGADLTGADLTGAILPETDLDKVSH